MPKEPLDWRGLDILHKGLLESIAQHGLKGEDYCEKTLLVSNLIVQYGLLRGPGRDYDEMEALALLAEAGMCAQGTYGPNDFPLSLIACAIPSDASQVVLWRSEEHGWLYVVQLHEPEGVGYYIIGTFPDGKGGLVLGCTTDVHALAGEIAALAADGRLPPPGWEATDAAYLEDLYRGFRERRVTCRIS